MIEDMKQLPELTKKEEVFLEFLIEEGFLRGREFMVLGEKPTGNGHHGSCCYCTKCWHFHDECVCEHNATLESFITTIEKMRKEDC